MRYENVAPPEVANHHLAKMYEMLGENQSHDDVRWERLTQHERIVFCRLAGCPDITCEKTASKPLASINADTRRKLMRAIKRMGHVAQQFNCLSSKRDTKKQNHDTAILNNTTRDSHLYKGEAA